MNVLSVSSQYSDQPEQKVITVSRVQAAECPYRYFKEYVQEPREQPSFRSIEAGIGSFFHSYLENHFKGILARGGIVCRSDTIDVSDMLANFRLSFIWEGSLRAPYKVVRAFGGIDEFVSRLKGVGENFNHFVRARLVGEKVFAVEGQLEIRSESFYIRGKHDLITSTRDGSLVLWDWKSGRMPDPADYREYRNQKIQLGIYAVWMRYKYQTPAVKGIAVFLRDGGDDCLSETFTPSVEEEVLSYLHEWRTRLNGLSSYPPIPNTLCPWCGWNPECPTHRREQRRVSEASETRAPDVARQYRHSRCFIAGAVFENDRSAEVTVLRAFRDKYLSRTRSGRAFVRLYERLAPPVAAWLTAHPGARRLLRWAFRYVVIPPARAMLHR